MTKKKVSMARVLCALLLTAVQLLWSIKLFIWPYPSGYELLYYLVYSAMVLMPVRRYALEKKYWYKRKKCSECGRTTRSKYKNVCEACWRRERRRKHGR